MKTIYALLWESTSSQQEFDAALPALMQWLGKLKQDGRLRGCGGFGNHEGGLTLLEADDLAQATVLAEQSPQARLGRTRIFEWEVYDADLHVESPLSR